jgi:hypothetical protein
MQYLLTKEELDTISQKYQKQLDELKDEFAKSLSDILESNKVDSYNWYQEDKKVSVILTAIKAAMKECNIKNEEP